MTSGKLAKLGLLLIGIWVVLGALATILTRALWLIDIITPLGFVLVGAGVVMLVVAGIVKLVERSNG